MTIPAPPAPDSILDRLRKNPDVITTKDGVEAFGFYVELVRFTQPGPVIPNARMDAHYRIFLLENSLSLYSRQAEKKAGRWTTSYYPTHLDARAQLFKIISGLDRIGRTVEVRGEPLLIQASVSDIVAIRAKEKHGADSRWRGGRTLESRYGQVSEDTTPKAVSV